MKSLFDLIKNVWDFRPFIFSSILNENKTSYANSRLGRLWIFLSPLAQAAVLAFVLSKILNAKFPQIESEYAFAIYLLAGTLGWSMFAEAVGRLSTVFVDNANLIKKVNFPKVALLFMVMGSVFVNHILLFLCTIFIYLVLGYAVGWAILFLPLVLLANVLLSAGLGLLLGILNVFLRDIGKAVPILIQFGFWVTPIVYHINLLPESFQGIIRLNPMYYVIRGYQDVLVYNTSPHYQALFGMIILGGLLLLFSLLLYRKAASDLVDAI